MNLQSGRPVEREGEREGPVSEGDLGRSPAALEGWRKKKRREKEKAVLLFISVRIWVGGGKKKEFVVRWRLRAHSEEAVQGDGALRRMVNLILIRGRKTLHGGRKHCWIAQVLIRGYGWLSQS